MTTVVIAQDKTHTVKAGETVSTIAAHFNAPVDAILRANDLDTKSLLQPGQQLSIPAAESSLHHYKVRNGDCDWTIARKFNTSIHKLHLANPDIENWDALRNGKNLVIPGKSGTTLVASAKKTTKKIDHKANSRPFVVSGDDTDWVIAHHLGVSVHLLHELNPDVDWNRLRPGKHILVPGSAGSAGTRVAKAETHSKLKVNRIRSRYAVINSDAVSIRREAGAHAHKITTVDTGTRVVVLDRDGAWYKLRFPRGTEGWVRGDFLNSAKAPATRRRRNTDDEGDTRVATRTTRRRRHSSESLVAIDSDVKSNPILKRAIAMRGTPYQYGESSRSGTDCSGFTWQIYKTQGVHLPRTSREQSEVGQPVKKGDLKPGDLLFFGSRRGRGVHHVAIYAGNGKFIHASSGGGKVQFNSLSDDYYHNHYKGARRVVKLSKSKHSTSSSHASHSTQTASSDTNATPLAK